MDLVGQYANNVQVNIKKALDTGDDSSVSMADWLMVHKVQKHLTAGDQRSAAKYVALRLEEDPAKLSTWAADQMSKTPLKATKDQVIFTNAEGEARAFKFVRAQ